MSRSCGRGTSDVTESWAKVLAAQPDMMWGLIADVVKAAKASDGQKRTGRRPAVSLSSLDELYDVLFPELMTTDPFPVAFARLLQGKSQRQFAMYVGFNQATVSRLLAGKTPPSCQMIERIAHQLKVKPCYFREYRALKLGQLVTDILLERPDLSAAHVKRLGVL